jgi:hypothetical protein
MRRVWWLKLRARAALAAFYKVARRVRDHFLGHLPATGTGTELGDSAGRGLFLRSREPQPDPSISDTSEVAQAWTLEASRTSIIATALRA